MLLKGEICESGGQGLTGTLYILLSFFVILKLLYKIKSTKNNNLMWFTKSSYQ